MADDVLGVRYGQKIRLATTSAYAAAGASDAPSAASHLLGIGYYEKNGRHGILSCVPPLGDKLAHLFNEDEYLVLDPSEQRGAGEPVHYGHTVVLVNQHGMVWNNKTGGITGYVGPRPRNQPGEMFVAFHNPGAAPVPSSGRDKDRDKTASAPALLSAASTASSAASSSGSEYSGVGSARSEAPGPPVRFGDQNVAVVVVESNRHSQKFNKRLSNFKKPTSRIAGGYICCDGKGVELRFTLCPAQPRVEQISMLNKLITTYHYGQKIALPLALLESSCDKAKTAAAGGLQQTEIRFTLSNHATAVLPGALLQEKLLAHAVPDGAAAAQEKESVFALPLRNGPGELVLKLTGAAPRQAIGKLAGPGAAAASGRSSSGAIGSSSCAAPAPLPLPQISVFYKVVDGLRLVPVPVFALAYAVVTHFLWSSLGGMEDGLKRELVVLVLVAFPAFYVAVKVEHPFSSFFEPPSAPLVRSDAGGEAPATATLKLIVVEYRFELSASASASPAALTADAHDTRPFAASAGSSAAASSTALVPSAPDLPTRFMLAEKGDGGKALARYTETLAWRREEQLSQILFTPSPGFKVIKENYPHYYHKRGKNGEPVYYEKPGKINLKALKGAGLSLDDLMHNYIMVTEFLWQVIEPDDNKKCISVVDVEGIGISDFRGEAVEYVKKAAAVSGKHYPERCAYIIVINIPSWFNVIWNVVKTMIDEVTREKVVMVRGKKNILEALKERIPLENIPEEYGGLSEGSSPEETMLHDLMAFLNKDADAPAANPIAHLIKQSSAE
ncbi:hypothetical protein PybrP1_011293 [[Pythium] brassicae (nom. inval.)]|nr:hypothetical protein PybrP1_011293 [[Pythium] brassicae (nom. inval.)]